MSMTIAPLGDDFSVRDATGRSVAVCFDKKLVPVMAHSAELFVAAAAFFEDPTTMANRERLSSVLELIRGVK